MAEADTDEYQKLVATVEAYKVKALQAWGTEAPPDVAVILGSGLGGFAEELDEGSQSFPFTDFPGFRVGPAVQGHDYKIVFGKIGEKRVLLFKGRKHFYQGHDDKTVMFMARSISHSMWRAGLLIVTNAAGYVDKEYKAGDIMVVTRMLTLFCNVNMLFGDNDERIGPRFFGISQAFRRVLIRDLVTPAYAAVRSSNHTFVLRQGVYAMRPGPYYEDGPDARALFRSEANVVGMSTVPDVLAAVHAGQENIIGLSLVTNESGRCVDEEEQYEDDLDGHEEVLAQANASSMNFRSLVRHIITLLTPGHLIKKYKKRSVTEL